MSNNLSKNEKLTLSVILPCRNEEQSLRNCIDQINDIFLEHGIAGEIIVSDSSTDRSPYIASQLGVRVHKHDKHGYGIALLEGFSISNGKYIFFADPDGSYDFKEIPVFLLHLEKGYDFIIGDRFKGEIESGAMPWLHRYIGNPLLSWMFRRLFNAEIRDVHCGMRAISRQYWEELNLKTPGMEFASEMVMKAVRNKLKIKELPINYHMRKGQSKLETFVDGWRHLRFMLMHSSLFLFLFPEKNK